MPAPAVLVRFMDLHANRPLVFWGALAAIVAAALALGALIAPEIVVQEFIWKNFWGPTLADANQTGRASRYGITVTEDYTLTSEIVYGAILAGALYSIYHHLFRRPGLVCDGRFILALTPYILFGPVGRVLEDANVFCRAGTDCDPSPFSYPFISPLIYLLDAAVVVAHMLIMRRLATLGRRDRRIGVAAVLGLQFAVYGFIVTAWAGQFSATLSPLALLGVMAVSYLVYETGERRDWDRFRTGLLALGLPMLLGPSLMVARWVRGDPWAVSPYGLHGPIVPYSVAMSLAVVAVVWIIARSLRNDAPGIGGFAMPLNLGLLFGHMLDGFATFLAVCGNAAGKVCTGAAGFGLGIPGTYGEKHPVSAYMLTFANGWGFPAMKLALVLVIVYLIDRSTRDGGEDRNLVGLVKMAVLILGLAPGTRDLLRVAMGV